MDSNYLHVTLPPPSPSIPDITPRDSLEDDIDLAELVEDFMRVTELQISLKKRIESALEKKAKDAEEEEEKARLCWVKSQAKTRAIRESSQRLKEKIDSAQNPGQSGSPPEEKEKAVNIDEKDAIDLPRASPTPPEPGPASPVVAKNIQRSSGGSNVASVRATSTSPLDEKAVPVDNLTHPTMSFGSKSTSRTPRPLAKSGKPVNFPPRRPHGEWFGGWGPKLTSAVSTWAEETLNDDAAMQVRNGS
jgi:hypothetical protein